MSRRYSQAVADLLPETGGWVEGSKLSTAEAVASILATLTDLLGTETKAREVLADAMPAELVALLPKRRRGRPKTATQQRKDAALLQFYDWKAAEGKSLRAIARAANKLGFGKTKESVERKLYRLLLARASTT